MNEIKKETLLKFKQTVAVAGFLWFLFLLYKGITEPSQMSHLWWWIGALMLSGIYIFVTPKDTRWRKMAYVSAALCGLLALITLTISWSVEAKAGVFGIITLLSVMWLVQRNEPPGPSLED